LGVTLDFYGKVHLLWWKNTGKLKKNHLLAPSAGHTTPKMGFLNKVGNSPDWGKYMRLNCDIPPIG
jgi:hypothetical protein